MAHDSNTDRGPMVGAGLKPAPTERRTALHRRRSIRLPGYDYSQAGAYFITIVTQDRACLFGDVVDGEMRPNPCGRIVQATWNGLPRHYPAIVLDEFVVMPNHIHGIITLMDVPQNVGAGLKPAPTDTTAKRHGLPEIIRALKTFSARRANALRGTSGTPLWQRNYYEHIIRNEESLNRIREYIVNNPIQWDLDRENPVGTGLKVGTDLSIVVGAGFKPAPTGSDEPWRV